MTFARRLSPLAGALIVIAGVLLGSVNERVLGTVTDEQVLLSTAFAIGTFGEIGVARGSGIITPRETGDGSSNDGGDGVSPYGLAWPALLAPVLNLAAPFERAFGSRSSQALIALLPIALIVLACAGSGLLARELGASPKAQALAALGTGLGSPLWTHASSVFTEPLQAALLVLALLCSVRGRAASAGLMAGVAVLAKSVNLAILPFLLLPLAWPARGDKWSAHAARTRLARATAGAAAPLLAWIALDIHRLGAPLSGYAGQHFSHPPLDGLWRLLVGPNEGLLLFFPLLLLSLAGLMSLARTQWLRGVALSMAGTCGALLAIYSSWWAWDGSTGWGPRLLMPIIPLLAAAAAVALTSPPLEGARRLTTLLAPVLLALGVLVNALGIAQADISASFYVDSCGSVVVPEREVPWFPDAPAAGAAPGNRRISRTMAAARDAAFAPLPKHLFLIAARRLPPEERTAALESPPWLSAHPDAVPRMRGSEGEISGILMRDVSGDLRWPHWGSALRVDDATRRAEFHGAWRDAALDQVLRALDIAEPVRAARLAREQWEISGAPLEAALLAAALREAGEDEALERFVRSLQGPARQSAEMSVVLALVARDRRHEEVARGLLHRAEAAFRTEAMRRALTAPLDEWPRTYRDLTR